jgi:Zn finger protein HypA/HybF involved in hydrogenase expression
VHELSLALEICRLTEEQVGRDALERVVTVAVEVGDDAGVDPSSLEFCLEALLAEPPFARATPRLLRLPGDVLRLSYLEVEDGRPDD